MAIVNEPVGRPVWSLQTMLRLIAQNDDKVLSIVPDGIYSEDTVASVSSFQERYDLPVTGITDQDTWYAVADEYRRAFIEVGPPAPVNPIFQNGMIIRHGEVNQHLYMIHGMMCAIGSKYSSMPQVYCNDVHDDASVAATQWLQVRAGIAPTGDITRLTWKHLTQLYRITVGDGTM